MTIFNPFAKQYEIAKIDETKSAAIIQVVETPVSPAWKSKLKSAVIVIPGTFVGFFGADFAAF